MHARLITAIVATTLCSVGLAVPTQANDIRQVARTDTEGMHVDVEFAPSGPSAAPSADPRDGTIIWHTFDGNTIAMSVALVDTMDETWIADRYNPPRINYVQTSGDGTPLFVDPVSTPFNTVVAVASAENASLGVVLTEDDTAGVVLQAYTGAGGETPRWTYTFDPFYDRADFHSVDVSADGSIVVAVASEPDTDVAMVVTLDGATGIVLHSGEFLSLFTANIELCDDGSRAVLTQGGFVSVIDPLTFDPNAAALWYEGGADFARISRDGSVVVIGSFSYRAYRDTGSGWTKLFDRTAPDNWFGSGLGVSGDGKWLLVVSHNYATGYLELTYRMIDLTTGVETAQITTTGTGAWQDAVQTACASADGTRFAVASWGTEDNAHPEVQVFDRDLNRIAEIDTPGSAYDIDLSADGRTLVAVAKDVHANIQGMGKDAYAMEIPPTCGTGDFDGGGLGASDVPLMVDALLNPTADTTCIGDMNGDESLNGLDIAPFIDILIG